MKEIAVGKNLPVVDTKNIFRGPFCPEIEAGIAMQEESLRSVLAVDPAVPGSGWAGVIAIAGEDLFAGEDITITGGVAVAERPMRDVTPKTLLIGDGGANA